METLPLHRFTLAEWDQLVDSGGLEDVRVELLEGWIVDMSPPSEDHSVPIAWLLQQMHRALDDSYQVRSQAPLRFAASVSEPQPDIAVISERPFTRARPTTALLAIEVAVSSLSKDRGVKARLYARAGVKEYWIVDVNGRVIEVYTEPEAGEYRVTRLVRAPGRVVPRHLPGPEIDLAALFATITPGT